MQENKNFAEWLKTATKEIVKALGIGSINIDFYSSNNDEFGEIRESQIVFSIAYDRMYKTARIYWFPIAERMFGEGRQEELTDGLIHEIIHIITDRSNEIAKKRYVTENEIKETNEELTETIAMIARVFLRQNHENIFKIKDNSVDCHKLENVKTKKIKIVKKSKNNK